MESAVSGRRQSGFRRREFLFVASAVLLAACKAPPQTSPPDVRTPSPEDNDFFGIVGQEYVIHGFYQVNAMDSDGQIPMTFQVWVSSLKDQGDVEATVTPTPAMERLEALGAKERFGVKVPNDIWNETFTFSVEFAGQKHVVEWEIRHSPGVFAVPDRRFDGVPVSSGDQNLTPPASTTTRSAAD